jgi:hypothetical protein
MNLLKRLEESVLVWSCGKVSETVKIEIMDGSCKQQEQRTAPWFNAWTTWPRTLRDLLMAADSCNRDASLPVNYG